MAAHQQINGGISDARIFNGQIVKALN